MDHPCLRPASLSDLMDTNGEAVWFKEQFRTPDMPGRHLRILYTAEWRLRGYSRSPE